MKPLLLLLMCIGLVNTFAFNLDSLKKCSEYAEGEKKVDIYVELIYGMKSSPSREKIDIAFKALQLADKLNYQLGKARLLYILGLNYFYSDKKDEARTYYEESLNIFKKIKDSADIGRLYTNIANLHESYYKFDSAFICHKIANGIFERNNLKTDLANSLTNIGLIIWRNGAFSEALPYFMRALDLRKELKLDHQVGMSLNNIGSLYWRWGNYEKALDYFQQSRQYREKENDTKGVILILNNIGLVYQKINYFDKAAEYFNEAIKMAIQINDVFGKAYSYHNIGSLYSSKKEYAKALNYCLKSLECYNSLKEMGGIVISLNDIGLYYENMGSFEKAKQYFNQAISTAKITSDKFPMAHSYFYLGRVLLKQKDAYSSLQYLEESLKMAEKQGLKELIKDNYLCLADNYSFQNNYKKAYDYLKLYNEIKDTLYTERLITDISNWRAKNETEKKINENKILRNENILKQAEIDKQKLITYFLIITSVLACIVGIFIYRLYYLKKKNHLKIIEQKNELQKLNWLLDQQNKELNETNKTKDKLFSVVAHDLKNPFQSLIGFSEIMFNEIDALPKEKIRAYAKNINESSRNLLSLTRNLLDWARVQSNKIILHREDIDVKSIFDELINLYRFNAIQKSLTVSNEIENGLTITADKHMLNTVMRNLLSNAIKFTGSNGAIKAYSEVVDNEVVFTVEDNGIGLTEEEAEKLFNLNTNFSKGGTNREEGTGLGLILCKDFIEKNGGRIWVKSEPGAGSKFSFSIPYGKEIPEAV